MQAKLPKFFTYKPRYQSYINKYFVVVIHHARLIFPTIVHAYESLNISRKLLENGMSGDAQIWTLVRAPHVYLDQSALRIFCDVTPARRAFHGSNFVQVVVAYFN